jgi:hypothetical protein
MDVAVRWHSTNGMESVRDDGADFADSVRRISMPESTFIHMSMNMVPGLRHGVLLIDAVVLVRRATLA